MKGAATILRTFLKRARTNLSSPIPSGWLIAISFTISMINTKIWWFGLAGLLLALFNAKFKLRAEVVCLFILACLGYLFRSNLEGLSSSVQVKMVAVLTVLIILYLAFRPRSGASVSAEAQGSVG